MKHLMELPEIRTTPLRKVAQALSSVFILTIF